MKVLLTALLFCCSTSILLAQNAPDFEKDADAIYQKLNQRAQKNGFRRFVFFNQGTPSFMAEPNTEYRIAFFYDKRRSDTLRAKVIAKTPEKDTVIIPFQVTHGPQEGTVATSIFYYTTPDFKTATVPVMMEVFPMGIVYVYKKKK
jgi:hypothetical protein